MEKMYWYKTQAIIRISSYSYINKKAASDEAAFLLLIAIRIVYNIPNQYHKKIPTSICRWGFCQV